MNDGLRGALVKIGTFVATVVLLVLFVFGLFRALGAPVPVDWIWRTLTGQFGMSRSEGEPVLRVILERMPATLELVAASIIVALAIGLALGALARRSPPPVARAIDALGLAAKSLPAFWFVMLAQLWVVTHSGIPSAGLSSTDHFDFGDRLAHLILPAMLLAVVQVSSVITWSTTDRDPADLAARLARKLPTIFAVGSLVEIFFAWPGDGRLLFTTLLRGLGPLLAAALIYAAIAIAARTATVADA